MIYTIIIIKIIIIIILGFFKLSIKVVPMNPQKATINILPIIIDIAYFLKSIFDIAAAILTANAGVNGIAINYECENNELFHRIVLDPNIGDYTAEMLKSLFVSEYGFSPLNRNGKLFNRVLRSQLYAKQKQVTLALD